MSSTGTDTPRPSRRPALDAEMAERARRLEMLVRTGLALTSSLDVERILPVVVESAARLFSGRAALLRIATGPGAWELRAAYGLDDATVAALRSFQPGGARQAAQVLLDGKASLYRDLSRSEEFPTRRILVDAGIRAALTLPLRIAGHTMGILSVYMAEPRDFSGDEVAALSFLAEQSALVIEHARLLQESEERASQLARQARELEDRRDQIAAMSQQLWQAAKLATMGELAASIAHELNNPLATVSLRVEALLAEVSAESPLRHPLDVIDQEVERMGRLVANVLQYSRRSRAQISTIDLRQEIAGTLELVGYQLRNRKIAVLQEVASDLPMIHADRQLLRQLFLNLLTNASDAMPEGGSLTLCLMPRRVASGAAGVGIEFVDTGVGIAPEDLPRVLEPFFTTKPEGRGTGLGLPLCRRIVEQHGGTLEIDSQVGRGTTVQVILPVASSEGGPRVA